jgi:hypothetical protein
VSDYQKYMMALSRQMNEQAARQAKREAAALRKAKRRRGVVVEFPAAAHHAEPTRARPICGAETGGHHD